MKLNRSDTSIISLSLWNDGHMSTPCAENATAARHLICHETQSLVVCTDRYVARFDRTTKQQSLHRTKRGQLPDFRVFNDGSDRASSGGLLRGTCAFPSLIFHWSNAPKVTCSRERFPYFLRYYFRLFRPNLKQIGHRLILDFPHPSFEAAFDSPPAPPLAKRRSALFPHLVDGPAGIPARNAVELQQLGIDHRRIVPASIIEPTPANVHQCFKGQERVTPRCFPAFSPVWMLFTLRGWCPFFPRRSHFCFDPQELPQLFERIAGH